MLLSYKGIKQQIAAHYNSVQKIHDIQKLTEVYFSS